MVTSLAEQAREVRAGEILVAAYTSPAWTPLFSLVAGIVLEHGGMLSHGAVVARECGIPCVAQVRDACTRGHPRGPGVRNTNWPSAWMKPVPTPRSRFALLAPAQGQPPTARKNRHRDADFVFSRSLGRSGPRGAQRSRTPGWDH